MSIEVNWIYPLSGVTVEWIYPWSTTSDLNNHYAFGTINVDGGTRPTATSLGDDLTITSSDSSISVIGSSTSNTVDLKLASSSTTAQYKEFQYSSGDLSEIGVWSDNTKITKLFTKTFSYSGGDLSTLSIYDEVAATTLTKSFYYDVNGDLDYIDEVIT